MTLDELLALLHKHTDGVLHSGKHDKGRESCALEFESQVRGRDWSDRPLTLPDLRPINDGPWSSNVARTAALLPVMAALWDWAYWSESRRAAWAKIVVLETGRQILAELRPAGALTPAAETAAEAARAASWMARVARGASWGASWETAYAAEMASWETAYAAEMASWAAARATAAAARAADGVLLKACAIWIAAAEKTRDAIILA